ncbi:MAG TPA: NAD-dependent epimerase/dehydratase family protein [Spirochaetia bacterium]|nr:NAD-dependent epimerase/dehydratase family protein [Spirochaetia bacterium]
MKCFVTGGAGFIGSSMIDRLLADGHQVCCYDNMSSGQERFLENARKSADFTFILGDLLDAEKLKASMAGCDIVFHFSANADVRHGSEHPRRDLDQNTIGTYNVLAGMLAHNIQKIVFSSTGSIYGECKVVPTPEDAPFPVQTSLYGASKLAGEGLISAFCEAFQIRAWIFRFVSILGERYTHGHVYDFSRQLFDDPSRLKVLGNGTQRKSYLYVQDCIDAILHALDKATERVNIFNLGTDEYVQVNDSIAAICKELGVTPKLEYSGGDRGWIGDNPFILLDCSRIRALGWKPKFTINESIIKTVRFIDQNRWVFDARF